MSIVQRQSTVSGVIFTGVLPAENPTVVGSVESWLERAQGGAFAASSRTRRLKRLYANLKNASTFTVSLYHSFSATLFTLYTQASPEVTGNVLLVQDLNILLAPGDQIRITAVGGTGAHLAELMFDPDDWRGLHPAGCA
jgi:hypothetical protein